MNILEVLDTESKFTAAIRKVADSINAQRKRELFQQFTLSSHEFIEIQRLKYEGTYNKGNTSKSMRKIASLPAIVDEFFTKTYGRDYYKDKDFFKKHYNEWALVDPKNM